MALTVFPAFADQQQHITPDNVIARLHYEVILRPQQPLRIVTEEWTHVFISKLPQRHPDRDRTADLHTHTYPYTPNCSNIRKLRAESCETFTSLFNTLMTLHKTMVERVNNVIAHIYDILPENHINRRTSGLFHFAGSVLHSLFGVATDQQVNAIQATAQRTITENAHAFHRWQKHAETMSVANQRLDNLANVIRDHLSISQCRDSTQT